MKRYTIFAGVNGAGKTSIYESIYYTENKEEKRINADEMVALILGLLKELILHNSFNSPYYDTSTI